MAKSNEAFWWSLFSAGGVMAALFVPAFILTTGYLLLANNSLAAPDLYDQVHEAVSMPLVRLVLFIVILLSLFHCAHRVRHTLMDLGLRRVESLLMTICYGAAMAGTAVAAVVLVRIHQ